MWALGYHWSVATAIGFIALAGVAEETGVVMLIYLDHAWEARKAAGAGASTMKRIAAPMVGGMVSSTVLTLVVIPAVYSLWREWQIERSATAAARIVVTHQEP